MKKGILFFIVLLTSYNLTLAQSMDSSIVKQFMGLGIRQFEMENYYDADITFRKILNLRTFIPDDLTYYYGNTLYQNKDYRLSQNFLEKYLDLTDSSAAFYDTTLAILKIVDQKIEEIKACEECDEDGFRIDMVTCNICSGDGTEIGPCGRCQGTGEEVCKVCFGEKVEIQRTSFGRRYVPCTRCKETGFMECQKCEGEKTLEYKCEKCKGKGKLQKRVRVIE